MTGVSVVVAAYQSHGTIERCLQALTAQTHPDFEIIVVDSSPGDASSKIAAARFPEVRFEHSRMRLMPHEARNLGVTLAQNELIAFTDADIYPDVGWLERLVEAQDGDLNRVVVGAMACYACSWLDVGAHLSKFDKWLPGGEQRPTDIALTGSTLCSRAAFAALGGFPGDIMLGDTLFSWRLTKDGYEIIFVPHAVVYHHHQTSLWGFLRERFVRGCEFGYLRGAWGGWSRLRVFGQLLLTLLPLRLLKLVGRVGVNARRAGLGLDFARTLPVVAAGESAWLAGEMMAYLRPGGKTPGE